MESFNIKTFMTNLFQLGKVSLRKMQYDTVDKGARISAKVVVILLLLFILPFLMLTLLLAGVHAINYALGYANLSYGYLIVSGGLFLLVLIVLMFKRVIENRFLKVYYNKMIKQSKKIENHTEKLEKEIDRISVNLEE